MKKKTLFGPKESDRELYERACEYGKNKRYNLAYDIFYELAENGNVYAAANLANYYRYGKGVPKDENQVFYWLTQATSKFDIPRGVGFDLAECYANGYGTKRNIVEAIKWYEREIENEKPKEKERCMYKAGCLRQEINDDARGFYWFNQLANIAGPDTRYRDGFLRLAECYEKGRGTAKDLAMAIYWYKKYLDIRENPKVILRVARLYEKRGEPGLSMEFLAPLAKTGDEAARRYLSQMKKEQERQLQAETDPDMIAFKARITGQINVDPETIRKAEKVRAEREAERARAEAARIEAEKLDAEERELTARVAREAASIKQYEDARLKMQATQKFEPIKRSDIPRFIAGGQTVEKAETDRSESMSWAAGNRWTDSSTRRLHIIEEDDEVFSEEELALAEQQSFYGGPNGWSDEEGPDEDFGEYKDDEDADEADDAEERRDSDVASETDAAVAEDAVSESDPDNVSYSETAGESDATGSAVSSGSEDFSKASVDPDDSAERGVDEAGELPDYEEQMAQSGIDEEELEQGGLAALERDTGEEEPLDMFPSPGGSLPTDGLFSSEDLHRMEEPYVQAEPEPEPEPEPEQPSYLYEGDLINGIPQGVGRFTYFLDARTTAYYEGDIVNGVPQGTGRYWMQDTVDNHVIQMYEGEFSSGQMTGQGQYSYEDGTIYVGKFRDGTIMGEGIYQLPSGTYYQGSFFLGKPNGYGTITSYNGIFYEGYYNQGVMNGIGRITYPDGTIYSGEIVGGTIPSDPLIISMRLQDGIVYQFTL